MSFFGRRTDSEGEPHPFGTETKSVRAFLGAVSVAPRESAPRLVADGAAAGLDTDERDAFVMTTLREARAAGHLPEAMSILGATEVACDKTALDVMAALVSPAAATAIRIFLTRIGPEEAQRLRGPTLRSYLSSPEDFTPDDTEITGLMAYYFALNFLIFQGALTLALRPFMPPERFDAMWSPFRGWPSNDMPHE